jgi:hypothetical protein
MTIETESDARSRAEEALAEEGYEDVTFPEDPFQDGDTWVVPAEHADGRLNVHVETESETVEVAELGE